LGEGHAFQKVGAGGTAETVGCPILFLEKDFFGQKAAAADACSSCSSPAKKSGAIFQKKPSPM
jgi:hypothetical protein